jgi:TldD protein
MLAISDSRVKQVSASLTGSWQAVQIMRADGIRVADIRPLVRINIWVAVEQNGRMESGGAGAGGRVMLDQWLSPESWQSQVDEALRIAILNLQSVPTPGWRNGSRPWRWLARCHAS